MVTAQHQWRPLLRARSRHQPAFHLQIRFHVKDATNGASYEPFMLGGCRLRKGAAKPTPVVGPTRSPPP